MKKYLIALLALIVVASLIFFGGRYYLKKNGYIKEIPKEVKEEVLPVKVWEGNEK